MIHQAITKVSIEAFRERSAGKKVVLLYPWTTYRTLFLSHFLSSAKQGLLYYRIPDDRMGLTEWLRDLVREFDEVLGGFGKNLRQALEWGTPQTFGEALAADLEAWSKKPMVLFLDELDRSALDAPFSQFATALINALPDRVQLAVSSRQLTYQPWYDLIAAGQAVVLGTESRKNHLMFTVDGNPHPQLEVYSFGRGHALVNGQEIGNWDGALPRYLFFYFMDYNLVTRDDIFGTFWPQLSVKEATNVFHVTKRKISERISTKIGDPDGNYELTQYVSGFYVPSDKVVRHYDVHDFQEAVERATITTDPQEEEMLYRRAVDIYRAPFLETIEMAWTRDRRAHLRRLYAQALIGLGGISRGRGDHELALGYYTRALKETPTREDIHREVMSLYLEMGRADAARQQYAYLENVLNDHLKIEPSRESRELLSQVAAAAV
jgi:DNA-binding SARP family transcriptional activator